MAVIYQPLEVWSKASFVRNRWLPSRSVDKRQTIGYILYRVMFDWDGGKNEALKRERNVSFEEVVFWIENDGLLGVEDHANQQKYPGQRIYIVNIEGYVYLVPFMQQDDVIFLKTIIPSRKATKKHLEGGSNGRN